MSNMNFNCDVCGREVQGCTLVNGMKFCAKCYQETFGETEKDRKINDLQSQLAKKEKEIEDLKAQRHIYLNRSVEECNRITDLEFELQHKDQDKISFAVDVLKITQDYVQQYVNDFDDKNDCLCAIDKQIKQLTYQHEDKGENK